MNMTIARDVPRTLPAGIPLPAIAPIDDGTDAKIVSDRLLRAAPMLLDHCPDVHIFDSTWHQPGTAGSWRRYTRAERPAFQQQVRVQRSKDILAVSYCARKTSSGFGLWRQDGVVWICWTPHGDDFDAWLSGTIPEFSCLVARA
jgi:hypothetical protein